MSKVIYPGSFDPVTYGHLNIIERASKIFDEVIIAVFNNNSKDPLFTMDERVELLKKATEDIGDYQIEAFSGLTMEYASKKGADAVIRGLRAVSDFEGEFQMAAMNKELNDEIETVFLMTDASYIFLSSSLVKEVASFSGDIDKFVPQVVKEALIEKLDEPVI